MKDQAWINGLRSGESSAFEAIFRAHFDALYRLALHDVRSQAVAEDILQDVFATLWEQRQRLDIQGSIEGYLVRAVRNRTLNYLRHSRVEDAHAKQLLAAEAYESAAYPSADRDAELNELDAAISEAVAQLPPRAREAYTLYHVQGLSYAEVAERMGISKRGVETNLGVAIRELRKKLQRFAPSHPGHPGSHTGDRER